MTAPQHAPNFLAGIGLRRTRIENHDAGFVQIGINPRVHNPRKVLLPLINTDGRPISSKRVVAALPTCVSTIDSFHLPPRIQLAGPQSLRCRILMLQLSGTLIRPNVQPQA